MSTSSSDLADMAQTLAQSFDYRVLCRLKPCDFRDKALGRLRHAG